MWKNEFVLCFNVMEKRFFEVEAIHLVEERYRRNHYRVSLRLNFYEKDVGLNQTDEMRKLCLRKITNLMTTYNMWQDQHSFYHIRYEVRLLARNNSLSQQKADEKIDESNSEAESMSTVSSSTTTEEDSAFGSSSCNSSLDIINENLCRWDDDLNRNVDSGDSLLSTTDR